MSNQEILEKAIQKAVDCGFTGYWADRYKKCLELDELEYLTDGNNLEDGHTVESLIFDHDFAKALWGDGEWKVEMSGLVFTNGLTKWQRHLQNMVISDDPIKYLGSNI